MSSSPQEVQARINSALASAGKLADTSDWDGAVAQLRVQLGGGPTNPMPMRLAGLLAHQRKEYARAENYFGSAMLLAPEDAENITNLGIAIAAQKQTDRAMAFYRVAVALKPEHWQAHYEMGRCFTQKNEGTDALESYRDALAAGVTQVTPLLVMGKFFHGFHKYDDALVAFEKASELEPKSVGALSNRGGILAILRRHDEARALLADAVELNPDSATAHCNFGGILVTLGDLTGAARHLRRAAVLDPACAQACLSLIGIAPLTGDDPLLTQMEKTVHEKRLPLEDQVKLNFALTQTYDRLQRWDEAMAHAVAANVPWRKHYRYSIDDLLLIDRDAREVFDKAFFAQRTGWGAPSQRPVFVVGMPRSGTTLVEQVLDSHPDVHGAGEIYLLRDTATHLHETLASEERMPLSLRKADVGALRASGRDYLDALAKMDGDAARVIDKMPGNFRYLGYAAIALPQARVIHCRRHPLDICLSCYFQMFEEQYYSFDLDEIASVYESYEATLAHWRETLPLPMLEIRYEDLVQDQEAETRRLLDHLDLPFDEQCMRFHESDRRVTTASKGQVRKPVYTSSVARWRNYEKHLAPLRQRLAPFVDAYEQGGES